MDEKKLMQCIAILRKKQRTENSIRVGWLNLSLEDKNAYYEKGEVSDAISQLVKLDKDWVEYFESELKQFDDELVKTAERKIKARKAKAQRVRKRIDKILENECLFLTFTFTDEVLNSTTFEKRKRYIKDFLGNLNCPYVANLDYGKKNGREHYHAVVGISSLDYTIYKLGALNGVRIKPGSNSIALSRYIVKLTSHALKNTARTIIYSRIKK